jgi:diacylglycerol kinase family enzyme
VVNPLASRLRNPESGGRIVAATQAWAAAATDREAFVIRVDDRATIDAAGAEVVRAGCGLVVALGGDGTVAALTADLAGTGIPLAIVPGGTGNVLATALGVPDNPRRAIAVLDRVEQRRIDLGSALLPGRPDAPPAERLFAVAAGVGWDARVMAATAGPDKHRLGRLAYWTSALGLLGEMTPVGFVIEVDDRRLELEATVALVANAGDLVPGLVRPRLPIVPDDGLLDLLVLRVGSIAGGVRGALELLSRTELGGSPSGEAFRARGRRIRIEAQPEQPRQVDGDDWGSGAIEATIRAATLDVLVPPLDP